MGGIYAARHQLIIPREHDRPRSAPWINKNSANEEWLERRIGASDLRTAYETSMQMHVPLPILGTGAFVYKGMILPVIAGGAGFASLSDLISEATTGGKLQPLLSYSKIGVTGVANRSSTLWYEGNVPGVGATSGAFSANGTNHTRTTAGAMGPQYNAAGSDTLHLLGAEGNVSVAGMPLLLYDRIWGGEPAATTTGVQTTTMTAARYAGTGAGGTSVGNFCWVECRIGMTAAGTMTLNYVDDAGSAAENAAAVTFAAGTIKTNPFTGLIGIPLNAGDAGISNIKSVNLSSSLTTTPSITVVLAHPLMFIPGMAGANAGFIRDGINSAFNFQRIYDDACLALLEPLKTATTATTYTGYFTLCSG